MHTRGFLWLPALLLLSACVTINIYFPAAAAEKAADKIIREVWGQQPAEGQPAPAPEQAPQAPAPEPQGSLAPQWRLAAIEALGRWLVPEAHAAEADINVSTPAIRQIEASMKGRHAKLEPHYASGAIGVTAQALVAVRDLAAIPLPQRNQVKQLVADENRDRNALYGEIARANGHPEWEGQIRDTFAKRWADNAHKRGWWVQGAGGWKQ